MAGTIHTWVNYLTQEFKHTFGIDLWKKYPAEQVGDLEDGVVDKDGFKSRLTSLAYQYQPEPDT